MLGEDSKRADTTHEAAPVMSIVVPHRGPPRDLWACLQSLAAQTVSQELYETIVVMNQEKTGDFSVPCPANTHIVWEPKCHSYAARNRGVSHSRGKVIAFVDSDTQASPDWLERGLEGIEAGADMVAGKIELIFVRTPLSPSACYEKLFAFDQEKNVNAGRSVTANLFVRRTVLKQLGGFDEAAESGDDFRWTRDATESGFSLTYSKEAVVHHPAREKIGQLVHKARRVSRGFRRNLRGAHVAKEVLAHCRLRYLVAPSPSKLRACTTGERLQACMVSGFIQCVKVISLVGPARSAP